MRIIVTGATGFIGRHISIGLIKEGYEVIGIGRNKSVGNELEKEGVDFRSADISSMLDLSEVFTSADCIVHCAAKTGGWGSFYEFYHPNVTGTENVIKIASVAGINKMVTISSPSIYYSGRNRENVKENDPLPKRPANHYSATKLIADNVILNSKKERLKSIILRPRAVHGPYDTTIIPHILRLAEKGKTPLINGGSALTDITYIDNLLDAVVLSINAEDSCWNEIYNISNGDPITIKDWFERVLAAFGREFNPKIVPYSMAKAIATLFEIRGKIPFFKMEPPMTRFSVGYLAHTLTMSIEKAKTKLGFQPAVSNQEGFKLHASWYLDRQMTDV